jgi:hypothetical protein
MADVIGDDNIDDDDDDDDDGGTDRENKKEMAQWNVAATNSTRIVPSLSNIISCKTAIVSVHRIGYVRLVLLA